MPFAGRHNIANALAAAVQHQWRWGRRWRRLKQRLAALKAVPGASVPDSTRGENQLVLDDAYNANVGSLTAQCSPFTMPGFTACWWWRYVRLGAKRSVPPPVGEDPQKRRGIDRVLKAPENSVGLSAAPAASANGPLR
ncbi:hypothetical protein KCP73_07515 [Salmonella enterica subsp. enterica]|nr:hypothetical protein KCP73_07515 [Salmonella enterica subsp. enterica]